MLVLGFKCSEPIAFERYFGPFLKKNYKERPESFQQDFSQLDALRKEVTTLECSTNSVKACYKYP
jgi:hypothetical protein